MKRAIKVTTAKKRMALARIGQTSAVVEAWRCVWQQDMSEENTEHFVAAVIAAAHDANIILDGGSEQNNPFVMSAAKHITDEKGVCWKHITVKGDDAWALCGRASYEAVIRCDEHSLMSELSKGGKDDWKQKHG